MNCDLNDNAIAGFAAVIESKSAVVCSSLEYVSLNTVRLLFTYRDDIQSYPNDVLN